MKFNLKLLSIVFFLTPMILFSQKGKKKANKDTYQWRYEIEVVGVGAGNSKLLKVWSYSNNPETAAEQAKKKCHSWINF